MESSLRGSLYLTRNTVASIVAGGDTLYRTNVDDLSSTILNCINGDDAESIGCKAFLWCYFLKSNSLQLLQDNRWYLELCPTYLSSIEGVTYWAARRGWSKMRSTIGWLEANRHTASYLGARLRDKRSGTRFGRHVVLEGHKKHALFIAAEKAKQSGAFDCFGAVSTPSTAIVARVPLPKQWNRLQRLSGRPKTIAISCPNKHNHNRGDKNPSLVLWVNSDLKSGGAQCMVCRCGDKPTTYSFKVVGNEIVLRKPAGLRIRQKPKTQVIPTFNRRRHKQNPYKCIGGMTTSGQGAGRYVGASLMGCSESGKRWRTQGQRLSSDPISAIKWSEARSKGSTATDRAHYLQSCISPDDFNDIGALTPTSLCSVSKMKPSRYTEKPWGVCPEGWEASSQEWVLIDIDDAGNLDIATNEIPSIVNSICQSDTQLSGEYAIVRTGPVGFQVWCKLLKARYNPVAWFKKIDVRLWYRRLAESILNKVQYLGVSGGHIDMSSCAAGRYGRRPGWRLMPDGTAYRSSLIGSS